jgi:hypothetical protein
LTLKPNRRGIVPLSGLAGRPAPANPTKSNRAIAVFRLWEPGNGRGGGFGRAPATLANAVSAPASTTANASYCLANRYSGEKRGGSEAAHPPPRPN